MTSKTTWKCLAAAAVAAVAMAGCSSSASSNGGSSTSGSSSVSSADSMVTTSWHLQPVKSVEALVPAQFKTSDIQNAIYNDFPPEEGLQGTTLVGIQPDIALALSEVMGAKVSNASVGSFDSLIPGVVSGRYDMSSGDFGVTSTRLQQVDFVTEFAIGTAFAVKDGSNIKITKPTGLCGHSIGVQAGSYFIGQIKTANQACTSAGLSPIDLQTFPDDGARILAVMNGRVQITATTGDALAYEIQQQHVGLELQPFVYQPLQQAIVIPKGSALGPAVEAAMKEIIADGTYAKILRKWGVASAAYTSPDQVELLTQPSQAS